MYLFLDICICICTAVTAMVKAIVYFILFDLFITLMRRMPRLTWGRADRHTSGKGCTNLFIERVAEKLRRITWERKEELEKQ